jgi:hypothetical protein
MIMIPCMNFHCFDNLSRREFTGKGVTQSNVAGIRNHLKRLLR